MSKATYFVQECPTCGRDLEIRVEYLGKRVDRAVLDGVAPGERICVARQPFTFLYAPAFHREKRYAVQEATGPADCKGARSVDP